MAAAHPVPTDIPIFDGHNDALTAPHHDRLADAGGEGHVDVARMRAGGVRGGIFAVFTESREPHAAPTPQPDGSYASPLSPRVGRGRAAAASTAAAGRLFALERDGLVRIARSSADLRRAAGDDGPPLAVLHLEGAEAIDPALESLDTWYAAGLRSLGPVWSRPNAFAHGVPFVFPSSPDTGPGLTRAGRALVRRCAALGIAVDLSHMNERGFWEVAKLDLAPLVVSHAGAHAIAPCSRNLTDAQIDAVAASGGLVGVVFACSFLRPDFADDPDTPLARIVAHVRHIAERVGVEHVAFGSDFDGATIPAPLGDVAGYPRLIGALADAGFGSSEIRRIAWDNWLRVLDAWWR
ncbi:MAG: dipeptidase [Acidobacteriota bacterium]|nr:dipeptidase [Acidobacteriota bacterium]